MAVSPPSGGRSGRGSPMVMSPASPEFAPVFMSNGFGATPPAGLSKPEFRQWRVEQGVRGTRQEMEDEWTRYVTTQRPKSGKKPAPPGVVPEDMRAFHAMGQGATAALRSRLSPSRRSPKRSPKRASPKRSPTRRSPGRRSPGRRSPNRRNQYKKAKYQALVREIRAALPPTQANALIARAKESVRNLKTAK